ncbi:MAG: UvrD-helicase domain-containing protein [Chlorobiaceae bacterium]
MHEEKSQLNALTIVSAGAGTGKTHYIQQELAKWVKEKLAAPDRIVAVTFTETAAAELKSRIRESLVRAGMLEEALLLDNAYISTIHSFGLRLIGEFAFDAGLSPSSRLLNDDEVRLLLGTALAISDKANELIENLEHDGYTGSFDNKLTAEEQFRRRVLGLAGKLRSVGKSASPDSFAKYAEARIKAIYGETMGDRETLRQALYTSVNALMDAFPSNLARSREVEYGVTIRKELWENYRDLTRARSDGGEALKTDWKLWERLRKLKSKSTKKNPLPEKYVEAVQAVIAAADRLPANPGPLEDALSHAVNLLGATFEVLDTFSEEKKRRGLVDYTDMVSEAQRMLTDTEGTVLSALLERLDCLVVDEFQDTNPLQFSLLWSLTREKLPTVVVGDLKQAIMGFQNADSRLFGRLCADNPANTLTQGNNYRSSAQLMKWINQVGKGLFGSGYTELAPKATYDSRVEHPLEVIESGLKLSAKAWAAQTVRRISELLHASPPVDVYDKQLKVHRPLRGGDIAIICYKNKRLEEYAAELRKAGIRCRLEEGGWLETRIVQIAWYCLSCVADRCDTHAAAYLSSTELGHRSLQPALAAAIGKRSFDGFPFEKLDEVAAGNPDRTVGDLLDEIIERLDLYGAVSSWPDAGSARANLMRLQHECREFMSSNRDAIASGGYHGSGVKTFQAWLKGKVERDRDGNLQPEPSVGDDDAVQLMTWHRSKGREWPVVAVCGMDQKDYPRLPAETIEYPGFEEIALDGILEDARIGIYPTFAANETPGIFQDALWPELRETMDRLLYVAMTRAREKVILEWPSYMQDSTQTTYWSRFVSRTGALLTPEGMAFNGVDYPCLTVHCAGAEVDAAEHNVMQHPLPVIGRRAIEPGKLTDVLTPESITPSSLHNVSCTVPAGRVEEVYGGQLALDFPGITDPMEKGRIIHRAFEVLTGHTERKTMLADAVCYPLAPAHVDALSAAVRSFDAWLQSKFSPRHIETELPLLVLDKNGTIVSGFADMVMDTADGIWVIDHKSDYVPIEELRAERFNTYYPQLTCYVDALRTARPDKQVRGIILNWVSYGIVSLMETA